MKSLELRPIDHIQYTVLATAVLSDEGRNVESYFYARKVQ